jgi:RNA polymerase sigma-70 factor (sigma-E family)
VDAHAEALYRDFVAAELHPLLRTAYLLCGSWHTAEDLVQTTFVSLYRAWQRKDSWEDPHAYARRTLTNTFLSSRRRRAAREQLFAQPPDAGGTRPVAGDDAARIAERERQRSLLRRLPPGQRAVLVLRFWEDCSVADTAELLGISVGTVKSQTADALAALRRALAAEDAKEPSHD